MSGIGRDRDPEALADANAAERQRWNDPAWTSAWVAREQITGSVSDVILDHLALSPGETVLDIGSGGGGLSLAAAARVAPGGRVTGVDISVALVDLARSRADVAGLNNVTFVIADAQTDALGAAPFDVATSQFGVMFFQDPEQAFTNVGIQVKSGGRLVFACWQGAEENPWCMTPTLAAFAAPTGAAPSATGVGPFAFGDPVRVSAILRSSGWQDVERYPYEMTQVVDRAALVDDRTAMAAIAEPDRPRAAEALEHHLARFARGAGQFEIPLAFQVLIARRP